MNFQHSDTNSSRTQVSQIPSRTSSRVPWQSDTDSSHTVTQVSELPPRPTAVPTKDLRFKITFALLCIINLVCALDATILAVALPTIAAALKGTALQAFWAGTSFLLTSTVFVPTWISLSHLIARKPILIASLFFFTLGSLVCSTAPNFTALLVGRSIQGLGGGGISALTNIIISDLVSLRERGKWWGYIGLMWALGALLGPVIGGVLVEGNWRWIFWLNMPFCVVGLGGIPWALRLESRGGDVWGRVKREFDWIGSVLFIGSLTSVLVPLSWGGIMYPWSHFRTIVPLMMGLFGLITFFEYSHKYARYPLIRGTIFSTSTALTNFICTTCHGIVLWSLLYYMPIYYQIAKNLSPVMSGVLLFPFTAMMGPASVIVSIIISKTGKYRPSLWIGWSLATLGTLLLLLLTPTTPLGALITLELTPGLGFGILYPSLSLALQAPQTNTDLPFSAAMFTFFRTLGQSLGVSLSGNIFQNSLKHFILSSPVLGKLGMERVWSSDASALVLVIKGMEDGDVVKGELVRVYVKALSVVVGVCGGVCVCAMVGSLLGTRSLSLDRELESEQGWKGAGPNVEQGWKGAGANAHEQSWKGPGGDARWGGGRDVDSGMDSRMETEVEFDAEIELREMGCRM